MSNIQHSSPIRTDIIDDEIDLLPYIMHVIKHWRLFIVAVIVALCVASVLTLILPKKYRATTTFFVPTSSSVNISSNMILSSLGISASGGGGQSGFYVENIMPIFNSYKIKKFVAQQFLDHPTFINNSVFQALDDKEKIDYIIRTLNFSENVILDMLEFPHLIQYSNKSPDLIVPVLNAYLNALIYMNEELNIDSDLLKIISLDEAQTPEHHFSPNFKKLLILNIGAAIFILIVGLVIQKIVMDIIARK